MRKIYALFLALFLFLQTGIHAQTIVTTNAQLRNVVLEEFTGINCQYCPDGHKIAQALADSNTGRVVLVNIHQGSFAVPGTGQPDYRTIFGDAIAGQTGLTGYPSGTLNRHVFPDVSSTTALSRGQWEPNAPRIFSLPSEVNIGFETSFDSASRLLTVNVELYYTNNSKTNINYINVALLENNVIGYQTNGGANYNHKHMLRWFLTGQWGDTTQTTTQGSLVTKTYTYTVPANFNVNNCDVAVYVAESHQEIITGFVAPAKNGHIDGTSELYIGSVASTENADLGTSGTANNFNVVASNLLNTADSFIVSLTADAPTNWNAALSYLGVAYDSTTTIKINSLDTAQLMLNITPGATPYVGTYTISMKSQANPNAPASTSVYYVISGVTDLVVNNDAGWGDGSDTTAKVFENNYLDGLNFAGNTSYASTSLAAFSALSKANKLTEAKHVYYNIGWSFPPFTDVTIPYFKSVLTNGGNLMISGQDAAWASFDATSGYSTSAITLFYTQYLKTGFVADGTSANNLLNMNSSDIYGSASSAITNVYGGSNMYPDELSAGTGALVTMYYNNLTTKKAGVRNYSGTYKTAYFGTSIEMIADINVRKQVMKTTHDWFHGIISGIEYNNALNNLFPAYPNPANESITIPLLEGTEKSHLQIFDNTGRVVYSETIENNNASTTVNTSNFENGIYLYRLTDNSTSNYTKSFEIIH
ncbi:MAG: Omp28-related outer membrane protein [Bacteroidota bacterium]